MNFRKQKTGNPYLLDTAVENIFLNEYMPQAPDNYSKVYLCALMYAGIGEEMTNEMLARTLRMEAEDVLKAWTYWEKAGVIKRHYPDPNDRYHYEVEFLSLKERLFSADTMPPEQKEENPLANAQLREMFDSIETLKGKMLSAKEPETITSWMTDFGASPELIVKAYKYCINLNKSNINYVGSVVKSWMEKGLDTAEKIEEYLASVDQRHFDYRRIFKALGFSRSPGERERAIMDSWFDEMNFTLEKILEACAKTSGISNPNINYVNKILTGWYREKGGLTKEDTQKPATFATVMKYYAYLREKEEKEALQRMQEVYEKVPRVRELDEEIRSCGMAISRALVNNSPQGRRQLKEKMDSLTTEKAILMTENGFEIDYMEIKYLCDRCNDTGADDNGGRCVCFKQRQEEAKQWQISLKK
ncbi:MAG: DnaD domain protein [Clostridia bacterium]|nr:DnaD domain protein [Clostridia bacterium]